MKNLCKNCFDRWKCDNKSSFS